MLDANTECSYAIFCHVITCIGDLMETAGFHLSLIRQDGSDGIVGFEANASNGRFSGASTWWGYVAALLPLAQQLKGFPHALGDIVTLRFAENCDLTFECIDHLGHIKVCARLSVVTEGVPIDEPNQSVTLTFKTVAASIDSFVLKLIAVGTKKAQDASLGPL